ncbi:hypothetical protein FNT36_02170 [Hymenobacter setariae]|uniref:Uncharacterized protein n=1 Tax=Hymenobacter setariae TaxID=2594794 RepID=A0A558C2B5_9BACT|nr:hypothetical protein [Hymenobacter setariae]TVT42919.1 hypothetical protein FNT36_02170 [Hymenobacter setariae]
MASGQEITQDEFRHVLLQVLGMEVSQAVVGKPFIGIRLGGSQTIEVEVDTEFWVEIIEYDFEFDIGLGNDWRIIKGSKEISRSDIFSFALGPIRRGPSLASLLRKKISTIVIKSNFDLLIMFTDSQELIVNGSAISEYTGQQYITWEVSTFDTVYRPLPNGLVKALHRGFSLRPTRPLRS